MAVEPYSYSYEPRTDRLQPYTGRTAYSMAAPCTRQQQWKGLAARRRTCYSCKGKGVYSLGTISGGEGTPVHLRRYTVVGTTARLRGGLFPCRRHAMAHTGRVQTPEYTLRLTMPTLAESASAVARIISDVSVPPRPACLARGALATVWRVSSRGRAFGRRAPPQSHGRRRSRICPMTLRRRAAISSKSPSCK
jgi:hypothetical protein